MAEKKLSGLRIAAITTDGVEQAELLEPKKALEEAGAKVVVLSPKTGNIQAFKHFDKADTISVDMELGQANPAEFDAVLLPGGVINADALRVDKNAQEFVRAIDQQGKPIAVIGHAPWLLISAGLVKGYKITSSPTLQDDIRNGGAQCEDQQVVRDRNLVSSRTPDDIPAFNREVINLLTEVGKRKVA